MSTYSNLHIHVVFSTQGRAPMIDEEWRPALHGYMNGLLRNLQVKCLAVNGTDDHVHLLVGISPSHRISDLVRELKKSSSAWARQRQSVFAWQEGYGAFAVSPRDVPLIRGYIAKQEEHHQKVNSHDELRALLEQAGVEIDERYFS